MWVDGYWVSDYYPENYYYDEEAVDPETGEYYPSDYWATDYHVDDYFQGLENEVDTSVVTISDVDRQFIYGILGYPNIDAEDTGLLSDDIIDSQVILPCLNEYFRWFPIEELNQVTLSSGNTSVTVDWPDDTDETFVYDVRDCRLAQLQDTSVGYNGGAITNPIMQFRNISKSSGAGRYGSRMDYGFKEIQGSTRFVNDAITNLNQVFRNHTDYVNKTVSIFSQNPGVAQITFARYSTNVDYIKWTSKREFLDLCRGELLLYWANNLKRLNPEFPVAFNVDDLVEDGQELKDLTLDKWRGKSKSVMMRG